MNFMFPLANYLTITQGYKPSHVGNDYGWTSKVAGGNNQPIIAAEAGTVITAVDGYGNTYPNKRIYGNYVIISHGGGWYTLYGHLLKGLTVVKGQKVTKGQTIGFMGNSGYSRGQHLHFELRDGGNSKSYAVDPLDYLTVQNSLVVSNTTLYPERIVYGTPTGYIGDPVERDIYKDQVEVLADTLRIRKRPELNDAVILGLANKGIYNVLETRDMTAEASNGYLWYRIDTEMWIATKEGDWTKLYKAIEPPKPTPDEELIDELTLKVEMLTEENSALRAEIITLTNNNEELVKEITTLELENENLRAKIEELQGKINTAISVLS